MATDLTNLTGSIYLDASFLSQLAGDLANTQNDLHFRITLPLTFGDGDDEGNQIYHDQLTIEADDSETIDLIDCLNPMKNACTFATIKAVIIQNASSDADAEILVGDGTFVGWNDAASNVETILPDGVQIHADMKDGWAIASGVDDEIKITNASLTHSATVNIIIVGVAAA